MSIEKHKILVFGSVENDSELGQVFQKANAVNTKSGPFSALIIVSDQLTWQHVFNTLNSQQNIDIPSYIYLQDASSHHEELAQLTENITLLESKDVVNTTSGFTIASAFDVDTDVEDGKTPLKIKKNVDILIGNTWPALIDAGIGSSLKNTHTSSPSAPHVKTLAMAFKPRYHFTSTASPNTYWERTPFKWDNDSLRACRFISLGKFGSDKKSVYAFNISSVVEPVTGAITECPYIEATYADAKKTRDSTDAGQETSRKGQNKRKRAVVVPQDCFFCLSNPNVDKSLIVSIAEESYIALAKGPLNSPLVKEKLGFSGHILLIPLPHVPTYQAVSDESKDKVLLERRKFIIAIEQMLAQHGLSFVYYEICRDSGVHVSTQIIPIPIGVADNLESALLSELRGRRMKATREPIDHANDTDYVNIQIAKKEPIVVSIPFRERFDMFLYRKVIANVLGVPNQADWRTCVQPEAEEKSDGFACREMFKPFEFSS